MLYVQKSTHFPLVPILAGCLIALLAFFAPQSFALRPARPQNNRLLKHDSNGQRRIALVIGNGNYVNATALKNPANDARSMSGTLKELGFDVISGINSDQSEMKRLIRDFGRRLKGGGVGLFYYAGHGVQSQGHNYLIPIDADVQSEAELEGAGVDVNLVLNYMDEAQNDLNILILDACRNNPFAERFRSVSGGLAQVDAPSGTLIGYATAPGRIASDGSKENGLYTSELLRLMRVPGLSLTDMFMQVRAEVIKQTGGKQVPWEASSLVGAFYFVPKLTADTLTQTGVTTKGGLVGNEPKASKGAPSAHSLMPLARIHFDGMRIEGYGSGNFITGKSLEFKMTESGAKALYLNGQYGKYENDYVFRVPELTYSAWTAVIRFKAEDFESIRYGETTVERTNILVGGHSYRWFAISRSRAGELKISFNNQDVNRELGVPISLNQWTVIACGFDLATRLVVVYVDGKRVGQINLPSDFKLRVIGSSNEESDKEWLFTNYSTAAVFHGLVSDLIIYDRLLSPDEFTAIALSP